MKYEFPIMLSLEFNVTSQTKWFSDIKSSAKAAYKYINSKQLVLTISEWMVDLITVEVIQ